MNERIKKLRKLEGLTQQEFGDRIGITKSSVSLLESGKNTPSDQTIIFICREFGVREAWLRTGEEPMKEPEPVDELEELFRRYNATEEIRMLVKMFLDSPPAVKAWISEKVREIRDTGTVDLDAEVAEYRRQRELEVSRVERSSVSIGQGGK